MSHTKVFVVLCALAFTLAIVLVRPLGARADDGQPTPLLSSADAVAADATPLVHQVPVVKQAPKVVRKLQQNLRFGRRVVGYAKKFIGVPYVYGGSSPRGGFDCSGFVRYVYQHFGVSLPHSSYAQFNDGRRIGRGGLRPGDLVFLTASGTSASTSATGASSTHRTAAPACASRRSAAGTARASSARGGSRAPRAVRRRLRAVAAHGHRAPHARAVARAVVEEPLADVAAARLEARPRAVERRA